MFFRSFSHILAVFSLLWSVWIGFLVQNAQGSFIELHIYYPEENLQLNMSNPFGDILFQYGFSTSPYSLQIYETYPNYFPWTANYTYDIVNSTDYVGPNHWMKLINVGENTVGGVYVELITNINFPNIVKTCTNWLEWGPCMPRHTPSIVNITSPDQTVELLMYPAFNIAGIGNVSTIFKNYFSPQLGNVRDISLYLPYSLIENPIQRKVNVLVLYDGSIENTQLYAFNGGFDVGTASGSAPESIIIGIPAGMNGTACPTVNGTTICNQRFYEMTPTQCNATINDCEPTQAYGGTDLFLEFTLQVVDSVLSELQLELGELSSFGFSLGGLTACYAVTAFPRDFSRGFCASPSVWWNSGELASIIKNNYANNSITPKAIVITAGTQEGTGYLTLGEASPIPWLVFINEVNDAFLSIGMGITNQTIHDSTEVHEDGSMFPSVKSNLVFLTYTGGIHVTTQWIDVFSYGYPLLYAYDYPYSFDNNTKFQKNSYVSFVYPTSSSYCSAVTDDDARNSDDDDNGGMEETYLIILCVFAAIIAALLGLVVYLLFLVKNLTSNSTKKDQIVTDNLPIRNPLASP